MNNTTWTIVSALIGAFVGSILAYLVQFLIFYHNKSKEDRRLHVQVVVKLTGTLSNLTSAVYRVIESSIWVQYAVSAVKFGEKTPLDVPTLMKMERESLLQFDKVRAEIESGLSEYWGLIGNENKEFTKLIESYRKCSLPEIESVTNVFTDLRGVLNVNIASQVSKHFLSHEQKKDSYYFICKKIITHLRNYIAPLTAEK
jgi:hypothetical protein